MNKKRSNIKNIIRKAYEFGRRHPKHQFKKLSKEDQKFVYLKSEFNKQYAKYLYLKD